jgi:alkanesulfonate monooxygenase SsuD/methylene tetrahydromethanopterin reductase-like flavin-dependent oxidoreductase (luciferase family)
VADLAHAAEDAGWDGVFVGDAIWCLDPLIQLAAAAMTTQRIRLGTMVLATPLRIPWTLAGQAAALDALSEGRLILGLGTGATWMGWQAFPDVVMEIKDRVGKLDEMTDILTQMFQRKQFDFDGKHYRVKLSAMDPMHYPPATVQQPRIPIWVPGVGSRKNSMQRVLKCDGLFPVKMDADGKFVDVTPLDVAEMKTYIDAHRILTTPFDVIIEGRTDGMDAAQAQEKLTPWIASGMTWWVESTWGDPDDKLIERIRQGPPLV